jgi:uncharacterized protein DUF6335
MAKRKTGAAKRKAAGGSRSRSSARKSARGGARKARTGTKKKAAARKGASKKAAPKRAAKATRGAKKTAARKSPVRASATPRSAPPKLAKAVPARKAPALNRPRRTVTDEDDDLVPTPPSSLDLDRHASAARSGRREMKQRTDQLTQTGPALTGGDVDADFESAYSVGDEAPGGDNPTPDQDIVDDIGRAVGVEYEDNEELKGEEKISKRDRKRWELDPASSEDYNDRD